MSESLFLTESQVINDPAVTFREVYGTPETAWIVGQSTWFATAVGSVGRPAPGRSIEIIDESGKLLPARKAGRIAVRNSDPGLFTAFHNSPERTAAAFIGDWFPTGEYGFKNEDGDLFIFSDSSKPEGIEQDWGQNYTGC